MPQWLRAAVHGIVLGRGNHLQIVRIVALHSGHKCNAHAAGEIRVLTIGLLSPAPARIAKDVDVRRPVRQPRRAARCGPRRHFLNRRLALGLVVFSPRFGRDRVPHSMHQVSVPRRSQRNRLGKDRRTASRHSMQSLVPPVVDRYAKSRNCRGTVLHLQNLLFERHPAYDVRSALFRRQTWILVWCSRLSKGRYDK